MKRITCIALAFLGIASCVVMADTQYFTILPGNTISITSPATGIGPPLPPPPPPPVVCVPPKVLNPGGTACIDPPATTPPNVRIIELNWARPERILTGAFGGDDIVAVRFTTGGTPSNPGVLPHIVGVEFQSAAQQTREANLSDTPGTMGESATLNGLPLRNVSGITAAAGSTITLYFTIAPDTSFWYAQLKPNTTYYVNVKNLPGFGGQMSFDLLKGAL